MNTLLKRIVALLTLLAFACLPGVVMPANIDAEMNNMFNSMGSIGNVTQPGAFRGQSLNLYTGGQLMMRTPQKNYNLAQIELPSLKAGCGGIDIYGGSFSFINRAQFVSLLKNIGSAAVGYAFKLALQTLCPQCDAVISNLQDVVGKINNMNINSCEAGEALVNTIAGSWNKQYQQGCENIGQYLGSVVDRADGKDHCRTNSVADVAAAETSTDPHVKAEVFSKGNVMWNALKKVGGSIDDAERELIMSITGTVILNPPDASGGNASYQSFAPLMDSVSVLQVGTAASAIVGKVEMSVYQCDEPTACLAPTRIQVNVEPFVTKVERIMTNISNKIATRAALLPGEIGFVNQTRLPVWKMLAIGNTLPNSFVAESLIESYKEVIALDYTEVFLQRALREAKKMLKNGEKRTKVEEEFAQDIEKNIVEVTKALAEEMIKVNVGRVAIDDMALVFNRMETTMRSQLPSNVVSMIEQSKAMAAGGR